MNAIAGVLPRTSDRFGLVLTIVLRSLFVVAAVAALDRFVDLGTSPLALAVAAVAGTLLAGTLAPTRIRTTGVLLAALAGFLGYRALLSAASAAAPAVFDNAIDLYPLELHLNLVLAAGALGFFTAWLFLRSAHWVTLEMSLFMVAAVALFAGHRDYRFDSPRIINTLAWVLKTDELTTLVALGGSLALLLFAYLFVSTYAGRPLRAPGRAPELTHRRRGSLSGWTGAAALLLAVFAAIGYSVHHRHAALAAELTANGVGQEKSEGLSPLGFHSALGATNQPAALVRLEGDYRENPFLPMLYLRESALSEYNGRELVLAGRQLDRDVSITTPSESYAADEDPELGVRIPIGQSVYALTDHKLAFAIDYPISITPMKNPNPSRFRAAYRAYSVAPTYRLEDLLDLPAGDSRWPDWVREHYVREHDDPRYGKLALEISGGNFNPASQAFRIVQYLNKNAVYTLTPNHEVSETEDPVAPFLFGDKRGYCVHFAHAMVYMFRSLGIPARIGTGYLTDLSQAKDGHILLRMSDRHAWAEVFFAGVGWVPFDVQPEQVESHGETPVDMKLLEELMSELLPDEEILPPPPAEDEPLFEEPPALPLPSRTAIAAMLLGAMAFLVSLKLYLRYSWLLPAPPRVKLLRSYRAILSALADLGLARLPGETRAEYAARIRGAIGGEPAGLTALVNELRYARSAVLANEPVNDAFGRAREALRSVPAAKRAFSFFNPFSAAGVVSWRKW